MGPIVGVVDLLLIKDPEGKDDTSTQIVDKLMESVSLLAFANDDLNIMRKDNIKTELNFDFRSSSQTPVTDYLFGDNISDQVKTIQDTNKVGESVNFQLPIPVFSSKTSWTHGSRKGKEDGESPGTTLTTTRDTGIPKVTRTHLRNGSIRG